MNLTNFHKTGERRQPVAGRRELDEAMRALACLQEEHRLSTRKLAHDLRNPINSILLMAQLLEETGGTPEASRIALRIQRQCQELSSIVDQAVEKVPD